MQISTCMSMYTYVVCMCVYTIYICVCVYIYTHTHTHTHTMEYYSAINENEIMSFAATWMNLDIIILSEASHMKTNII